VQAAHHLPGVFDDREPSRVDLRPVRPQILVRHHTPEQFREVRDLIGGKVKELLEIASLVSYDPGRA
jgi:hypothetical protein